MSEDLVDLSLFSYSPTSDHYLSLRAANSHNRDISSTDSPSRGTHRSRGQRDAAAQTSPRPTRRQAVHKPLPRPPPRVICGSFSVPRERDLGTSCLFNRVKRKRKDMSSGPSNARLPQRRNVATPPRLLLTSSQLNSRNESSELVWMPEEQMWLVVGEGERESGTTSAFPREQVIQWQASALARARSEPAVTNRHSRSLIPLPLPTQVRAQHYEEEERDEERLSPLFHEAMNSVPMEDTYEPPPPPSYEGTMRARSSSPGIMRTIPPPRAFAPQSPFDISPLSPSTASPSIFHRALSAGSTPIISRDSWLDDMTPMVRSRRRSQPDSQLISSMSNFTIRTVPQSSDILLNRNRQSEVNTAALTQSQSVQHGAKNPKSWSGWARKLANAKPTT